ncbi:integrin alpha [Algibacter sp. L3A6]|uniref:integrin alpha n=1 Tax=Algibacter sp. L3A6 TaxID=2686366 RepID=UPI0018EEE2D0|nr:FG-GAP repeat protein [Algibacter sp. L3A6]
MDATTLNVVSKIKITEGLNGFTETLDLEENPNGTFGAQFGHAMCAAGDIDGDGITDLVTGANQQNEGNGYILYLNADKTVRTFDKISATEGDFDLVLGPDDRFARSISYVGDIKGDGSFAVNFGGGVGIGGTGSLYTLFFRPIE